MRVLNYRALDDPSDLTGLLGSEPRLSRFPPVIDGVDLVDVRSQITVSSPTEARLELSVPTDTDVSIAEKLEFNDDGIHPIIVQLRADDRVIARHGTVVERRSGRATAPPTIDLSLFAAIEDPGPSGSDEQYDAAVAEFVGLVADAEALDASITMAVPPSIVSTAVAAGVVDGDDPAAARRRCPARRSGHAVRRVHRRRRRSSRLVRSSAPRRGGRRGRRRSDGCRSATCGPRRRS